MTIPADLRDEVIALLDRVARNTFVHGPLAQDAKRMLARLRAQPSAEGPTDSERIDKAREHVIAMARQAYEADAIHEWFDEEDDGLRAALDAYDAAISTTADGTSNDD